MTDADDAPAPSATRVAQERALVGTALVDPGTADWLVTHVSLESFLDPLAFRVFLALAWSVHAKRTATDLELIVEDLGSTNDLDKLGGRQAVKALVADRPELRQALAAVRAEMARCGTDPA